MVGTILPVVYGERQQSRRALLYLLYGGGSIVGSALVGALLGALGIAIANLTRAPIGPSMVKLIIGTACITYGAREFGLVSIPVLQSRWQVPSSWRRMPRAIMTVCYGLVLGMGFLTRIPASSLFVAGLWAILCRDPALGAAAMAGYGLGQGVWLACLGVKFSDFPECDRAMCALEPCWPLPRILSGTAMAFAGSSFLVGGFFV